MKVSIPLSAFEDYDVYYNIKKESFYFSTILQHTFKGDLITKLFNRRAYKYCYFDDIIKLREIISKLKENKNELKYAVNHFYSKKYREKIKKEIEEILSKLEVDFLIIEDLNLIDFLENFGIKVFFSTRIAPINVEEARFFYREFRKILAGFIMPRQLTSIEISEINEFVAKKGLKLEVFFELGGCLNEERFCFFHEILDFQKNLNKKNLNHPICSNIFLNSNLFKGNLKAGYGVGKLHFICKACELWNLKNKENIYLKIVGRCYKNERNYIIYKFAKEIINNLNTSQSLKDFYIKNRIAWLKFFKKTCNSDCPYLNLTQKLEN